MMIKAMRTNKRATANVLKIIDQITGHDRKLRRAIAEARVNAQVAQLIYNARKSAHLTQKELADLVGTTQSAIARLEDADYEGHSLSMLQKIAAVLNQRLTIRMAPNGKHPQTI